MNFRKNNIPVCACMVFVFLLTFTVTVAGIQPGLTFIKTEDAVPGKPELQSLLFDLQPTIYITPEGSNVHGTGAVLVADCAAGSVSQLYEQNEIFAAVKVIKVYINRNTDLVTINLTKLKSFDSLEYVHLVFTYDICGKESENCLPAKAGSMIAGNIPVTVLYRLSIPE